MKLDFTIYAKPNCVYCDRAKALIEEKGGTYEYVDVTQDAAKREALVGLGFRTVPVIYKGKTLIGTFEDLKEYYNE